MTTLLVLVILGLIWAAVLVPPYLQNRREHRPGDSIASFRHQLSVLERATPEGRSRNVTRIDSRAGYDPAPQPTYAPQTAAYRPARSLAPMTAAGPRRMSDVRRRRRDVFLTLLAAVPVTFLLAVAMGGPVWALQLLVDVALVGYVGLLVKLQQEQAEKDLKVRFLEPVPMHQADQPLLRRVGT